MPSQSPIRSQFAKVATAALVALSIAFAPAMPVANAQSASTDLSNGLVGAWNGHSWLSDQLAAQTPLPGFSGPSWGLTFDAALAIASVDAVFGAQTPLLGTVWADFVADRDNAVQTSSVDDPGLLAKAILLAVAVGEDPTTVGASPGADLVARLGALEQTTGSDAGLFGSAFPNYDGVYRQGLALRALHAVGVTPSADSVGWLVDQQCADGAWMPYRADLGAPCAYDSAAFLGPDSNSTAAAVHALKTLGVPNTAGVQWLEDKRNPDGGWGFFPDFPSDPTQSADPSDPNSTAAALQALISPSDRSQYASIASALMAFQIDCAASADAGAFEVSFAPGAGDLIATTQAVAVLALEGNLAAGDTPAADAGLSVPTAPCIDAPAPPTSTTTTIVDADSPTADPSNPGGGPTGSATPTSMTPVGISITG